MEPVSPYSSIQESPSPDSFQKSEKSGTLSVTDALQIERLCPPARLWLCYLQGSFAMLGIYLKNGYIG
jgi:hypothetical protein